MGALYVNMNSAEYKEICSSPDVLPRRVLEETLDILVTARLPESETVKRALDRGAISFPDSHDGSSSNSYHRVVCTADDADLISDYLFEKEAESVPSNGVATSETDRLVTLVNIWHELADHVQQNV